MNSVSLVIFHLLLASAFRFNDGAAVGCPGCSSPVSDPNSDDIRKLMSSSLSQTNSGYTLQNIKSCTSQVVSGIKYNCVVEVMSPSGQVSTCNMQVVDKPWDPTNPAAIVSETCSQVREKRSVCAGCPIEQDPQEMTGKVQGILSQTNSGLSLVKTSKCTSQVVAGVKYDCEIQVESPRTNGVQSCRLVFVEQPWISKEPQILTDTCANLVRAKREICAGCPVEQNPTDPEIQKKLTKTLSETNSGLTLSSVEQCTTQVVAGVMYDCTIRVTSPKINGVQSCHIKLLEQPWVSKDDQVVEDTCSQLVNTDLKRVIVGGYTPAKTNGDDVQEMANFAGSRISNMVNSMYVKKVISVEKAETQVVAGTNYAMTLLLGDTDCTKNAVHKNSQCNFLTNAKTNLMCQVVVYSEPWEKILKLTSVHCEDVPAVQNTNFAMAMAGGVNPIDVNSADVQGLTGFLSSQITKRSNAPNFLKVTEVVSASSQVVEGMLYHLKVIVAATSCPSYIVPSKSNCPVSNSSPDQQACDVTVWDRPWLNSRQVTEMNCQKV